MYKLTLKLFNNVVIVYPILLFGFTIFLLRYSTENKQYSSDVFFALLFLCICFNNKISSLRHYLGLGLLGAISIWFSMPLVFILTGVGAYLLYEGVLNRGVQKENMEIVYILMMGGIWLLSFALLFYVNLQESIGSKYLQDYHANSYLMLPTSFTKIKHSYIILRDLLSSMVGGSLIGRVWAAVCMLIAVVSLAKKDIGKLILLLLPVATCFFASVLDQFILIPRVCLFLMPLVFILIGLGASVLFERILKLEGVKKYVGLVLIGVAICVTVSGRTAIPYFVETYELEHARPVIQALHEHAENNLPVYVVHNGVPAYKFYTQLYEPQIEVPASSVEYGVWSDQLPQLATSWKEKGIQKIWIFDSHTFGEELEKLKKQLLEIGTITTTLQDENTDCYLIELR